jgi:hypothetical protein
MMKAAVVLFLLLAISPFTALAQPFDMSGERPADGLASPDDQTVRTPAKVPQALSVNRPDLRYLVPFKTLNLEGEIATRTWLIYLTPAEAAAARKFKYGYQNAIVVAPETSRLSVYVNDRLLGEQPVQSPGGVSERSFDLPKDLFRPGSNKITFQARHQHRTDCTIESTYELWSEIVPEKTFLSLDPGTHDRSSIEDVKAIGVDKEGRTRFRIVAPKLQQQNQADALIRLSQGLSLLGRMPSQSFTVETTLGEPAGPGELVVVVGTAADLATFIPGLPESAKIGPFAGFLQEAKSDQSILVLSGPTTQSVSAAIDSVVGPLDRPENVQRDVLWTQAWTGSETPILRSKTSIAFSKLGLTTAEFTGRRFRAGFDIAVPADFYANAYGEARILLDAAYSDEIQPGSHINIYVNGNIASTVPITSDKGGIFRHFPIRVTMRHFQPGANRIEMEAILRARSDVVCAPGAATNEPRFAIFDTSEFSIPDFARIGQLPNLAAVAGTGFPYSTDRKGITLFMDRLDSQTLSTTATFMAKLSVAAGRPLKTTVETSTARIGDNHAIFVGAISQIPQSVFGQVHIAEANRTSWGNRTANARQSNSEAALDQWRSRLRSNSWGGQIAIFENWLMDTFDLSFRALQFLPSDETDISLPDSSTFLIAQGLNPKGTGVWTVLSAPDPSELQQGMTFMSEEPYWRGMNGRLVLFDKTKLTTDALRATQTQLIETQPFSLANYRLIAADWLSTNILTYALLFAGFSILLGITTSGLLNAFGRRK